jgi:Aminotransferase class I and II
MDTLQLAATTVRNHAVDLLTFQSYTSVLQAFLLAVVVYTALTRAYLPRRSRDNDNEGTQSDDDAAVAAKLAAWRPGPLARAIGGESGDDDEAAVAAESAQAGLIDGGRVILKSAAGPTVDVLLEGSGQEVTGAVNMCSLNFLGLVGDRAVLDKCKETMKKYGCGACGPRGFYGTVDVHLECEAALAKMFGVPDAILYSFGSSAQSSVIPAFCKRGDVVVCDKGISFALQTGINLSRSDVFWFEHNNMADLERVLCEVTALDMKGTSRATRQRRFITVEGVYANYGDIAPLDEIVALKNKYNFRLVLDESASLGTLGDSGRGALEHFGVRRPIWEMRLHLLAEFASASPALFRTSVCLVRGTAFQLLSRRFWRLLLPRP